MPFAFSVQALLDRLQTLSDKRDPRGVRYPLPVLLLIAVLTRLAGHGRLEPIGCAYERLNVRRCSA